MIELYAVRIDAMLSDTQQEQIVRYECISEERRERIKRVKNPQQKKKEVLCELLLRYALYQAYGTKQESIVFDVNPYGKPHIKNLASFHFNLSHAGVWILCGIDDSPIGVDIEWIQPIDFCIAEQLFSPEEKAVLYSAAEAEQIPLFYRFWTLKESYLKALGTGLSNPLSLFTMNLFENEGAELHTEEGGSGWFFKTYQFDPSYFVSVCARHPMFPVQLKVLEVKELLYEIT
ncbi:4'-phosphopantetheinyl transferase [Aneurinibacillus soli]|uniref:4'-phosphopantetheinyl transferase sfp n=1 Tax=Aneurinibacillus soli TaxID=1500254 RepID=A0A0U5BA79_9BACL|nr:4'-phosphopantetheinyl transferase superfamily protein [Aneurinibacillus soli]PYE61624.1 4'-phosphopantetheinyl transferase [Aneurinibacillus soli]BAU28518.1 4'-phosphopantetheinyl transferase sfp [Aneurinibacillus soli]